MTVRRVWCGWLLAALAVWPTVAHGQASAEYVEYVDTEYGFTVQLPAGWQRQPLPIPGAEGEVRAAAKSRSEPAFVLAIVSPIGKTIENEQRDGAPGRDAMVQEMVGLALRRVYDKMARDLGAHRLSLVSTNTRPSDEGIRFSIETALATPDGETVVAGTHVVPFAKPYAIAVLVVSRAGGVDAAGRERLARVLDSLRLTGPAGTRP